MLRISFILLHCHMMYLLMQIFFTWNPFRSTRLPSILTQIKFTIPSN